MVATTRIQPAEQFLQTTDDRLDPYTSRRVETLTVLWRRRRKCEPGISLLLRNLGLQYFSDVLLSRWQAIF